MQYHERAAFSTALRETFATYRQAMPEPAVLNAWWRVLGPFDCISVADALEAHMGESDRAPVPADIARRCRDMRQHKAYTEQLERPPSDPAIVKAQVTLMDQSVRRIFEREATPEWAFALLLRGKSQSGASLTHEVMRTAAAAVNSAPGREWYRGAAANVRAKYAPVIEAFGGNNDSAVRDV
jgi:hypothetical protein